MIGGETSTGVSRVALIHALAPRREREGLATSSVAKTKKEKEVIVVTPRRPHLQCVGKEKDLWRSGVRKLHQLTCTKCGEMTLKIKKDRVR